MSLPDRLYSWRDTASLTNDNSHEPPSHWECHCNIPGAAQTHAWKLGCRWALSRMQGCLCRRGHGRTCIFKLTCQARESAHADAFTYEHCCRGPGCNTGWQVLCHCPTGQRKGRSLWNVTATRTERCSYLTVTVLSHSCPPLSSLGLTFTRPHQGSCGGTLLTRPVVVV